MALTRNDETDLLLPLYRGVTETPRFGEFLKRLRRRTEGATVSLDLHRTGALASRRSALRPYRVYTLAELVALEPDGNFSNAGKLSTPEVGDIRTIRIPVSSATGGVLTIARAGPCSAADGALLSNLAPYVETALATCFAIEHERFEAEISAEGLTRSGTGWILFDADAKVIAIEPATQKRLAADKGIEPHIGERLRTLDAEAERNLAETATRFANDPHGPGGSIVLKADPRIDAVLVPVRPGEAGESGYFPDAVMTAYCRFEKVGTQERAHRLAGLFDLPAREAELAMALADGLSIAEAAEAMGLTLETARNYSKRLYAQLEVRGQTGLVRLIHRSSAVLA